MQSVSETFFIADKEFFASAFDIKCSLPFSLSFLDDTLRINRFSLEDFLIRDLALDIG